MYVVTLFDISNPEQPVKLNFRTTSILPSPFSLFRDNKKVCAQQNSSKFASLHFSSTCNFTFLPYEFPSSMLT